MLKKIIGIFIIGVTGVNLAYATTASIYIAPSIAYQSVFIGGGETYEGITGKLGLGAGVRAWTFAYLGVEGFASSKPLNVKSGDPDIYKPSSIYGFSILPGYYFDDNVLGYARLGFAYANFSNLDAKPRGYNVGAGVDWCFYNHLSLRGEYNYTRYNDISGTGTLNQNEVFAGVVYRLTT